MTELFLKVLNLSIGAVPLMAVLLVLRLLFKKAVSRKFFYIAWALVFLRLMVPFSLESDLSIFNFVPKAAVVEENVGTFVVFVENENERVEFPVFINPDNENPNVDWVHHSVITGEIVTGPDITTVPMDKNLILSTVWIFGTGALLLFGIIGYFAVLKKTKFESIEYTQNIRLSEFFKTPVVCGLFRPKIILPMNFDLDDEAKITSVIAHECTHIRRGDNFWRLLASFTLYVHWFNPLVWICYDAFIRDMEVSCDEEVLKKSKNDIRSEYAESLVSLSGKGTNPLYGGVLSFGESAIKERVKCIMNFKRATLLIVIICIAVAAALGVIFLTNPSVTGEKEPEYEIVLKEGTAVSYSRESGIEMEAVITNTGDKTIWLDSAIIIQAEIDGKTEFAGTCGNGGVLMLPSGFSALFCGDIKKENFEGDFEFYLPEGKYTLRRAVFFDEALTPTNVYAEFSFEIKENNSLETKADILAFIEGNPDLLELIENPSKAKLNDLEYYKKANPDIPEVIVEFFYLYHSTFATLEVPDFSGLDKGTGNFYKMEQYLEYEVARERLENDGDYVTDFELEIKKESGDVSTYVYSCKYNYKYKNARSSGRNESGGVDTWKFVLVENSETGKEEIELFEWKQEGYGGLYPGLENIFEDIRMRYYPEHNDDYELIANIGICELLIENGYFGSSSEENKTSATNLASARIGNLVTFGNYNGVLEWLVIGKKDDQLLLITKDCIEALPYHETRNAIRWDKCDLREWLNEDFIEYAFSEEEKMLISEAVLENPDNKRPGGAKGGFKTSDKVFLLSHDEVLEYFPNGFNIYTEPTPSAEKNITKYEIDGRESWWWWTRSPGLGQDMATVVNGVTFGIGDDGLVVTEKHGVRPAMWVYTTLEATQENVENGEINPQPGDAPDIGETQWIIPQGVDVRGTLFNNKEKTSVNSLLFEDLRMFFKEENFDKDRIEHADLFLGDPFYPVDTVEFVRNDTGQKYVINIFENGFSLSGSAFTDEEKDAIYFAYDDTWDKFKNKIKKEFDEATEYNAYWLGLIHEKNISEISVSYNEDSEVIIPSEDCFSEIIYRLRNFNVVSPGERFTGKSLSRPEEKHVAITMNFNTGTEYFIIITENEMSMISSDMSYGLKYALPENNLGYDEFTDFAMEGGLQNPMTGKPVIYLYPEKETLVSVNLDFDGKLTYTYPALNNGWKVLAKPDGTLTNLADNSTHYYLFWEGTARPKWTYEKGFVVKGSETEVFLRENLAKMGLTPREYNDFITYWVPKMQENPYNLISFSGDEYSEIAKLTVNPKPDSVIRIHMMWKALDEPIEIEPQVLPVYQRKGFTLVEWGGTELY